MKTLTLLAFLLVTSQAQALYRGDDGELHSSNPLGESALRGLDDDSARRQRSMDDDQYNQAGGYVRDYGSYYKFTPYENGAPNLDHSVNVRKY